MYFEIVIKLAVACFFFFFFFNKVQWKQENFTEVHKQWLEYINTIPEQPFQAPFVLGLITTYPHTDYNFIAYIEIRSVHA